MSDEHFFVRLDGDNRSVRKTVAAMAPDEVLLAVARMERELQIMTAQAAPALALLQRAANGDRKTFTPRQLKEAQALVASFLAVQQQAGRLSEAVGQLAPARRPVAAG